LAQTEPSIITDWASAGVVGLVVVAALFGWIWFKPAVDRLQKDLDQALADLRQLERLDRESIIPAVTKSMELIERMAEELRRRNEK
jgi:hypothetical protein